MREPLPSDLFDEVCPTALSPVRVGDKWAAMILTCLADGPRRFSELRVPLRRVTPKVLTASLRSLERDGLIARAETRTGSGRQVEYRLTPLGESLLGPLEVVCGWVREHIDELLAARESFDAARERRTA
ncbi:transcriptional regulator [Streptomyces sp. 3MP-14]|uniref:Transcriptional regulator n=1 Tax=Streptomyces mimosae TaxID=2586635 RepID=A0A5N6A4J8_9ACTN|nr:MULTISPECIES: helix-turn-helix domain-containing protein [Streptomyces]KAB8162836.1 transcriptional regulator [Streptomyces mimosae]KAB8179049.1 transcriptional regulator [Streptomyces sp. 3MP-14]